MSRKSYIDRKCPAERGEPDATLKDQWSARCYLEFAARYLPDGHPLHGCVDNERYSERRLDWRPWLWRVKRAWRRYRNNRTLDLLYQAGAECDVPPVYFRELFRAACVLRDRERAERCDARFNRALHDRNRRRQTSDNGIEPPGRPANV